MNSRHLGEVDKLHFALHCLLFTLHFLLRTALKQHPSWCHVFKDVDGDLYVTWLVGTREKMPVCDRACYAGDASVY